MRIERHPIDLDAVAGAWLRGEIQKARRERLLARIDTMVPRFLAINEGMPAALLLRLRDEIEAGSLGDMRKRFSAYRALLDRIETRLTPLN